MNKAASPKTIPAGEPPDVEPAAGPGVSSLLKGTRADAPAEKSAQDQNTQSLSDDVGPSRLPIPVWYLFAADVVLLLFAFLLVFKDPASLNWSRILFASLATIIGGALAAAGVMMTRKDRYK